MPEQRADRASELVRRGTSKAKKQTRELLRKSLEQAYAPRTVGIFEYEMNPKARYGWGSPPHTGLMSWFAAHEADYEATVEAVVSAQPELFSIAGGRSQADELTWDNDWWAGIDAAVQYLAIRDRKPANYVEVGSGFSTRFARRAITDFGLSTKITSIDPHPRAEIDAICDSVIRSPLESADLSIFETLQSGDVVLIDCSHCAFMNSDVVVAFLDVMTKVPEGVLVGIDDIFLPWDYHPTWADRWYGEQYLLATLLLGGAAGWTVRFPGMYVTQESPSKDRFAALFDHMMLLAGNYSVSFWMERTPATT